jgi:hypothetical protein
MSRPPLRTAIAPVVYAAFVQLHHQGYERYALARLGDGDLGAKIVEGVLRHAESEWPSMLTGDPAAFIWLTLREAVSAHVRLSDIQVDRLHRRLPAGAADVALLVGDLGMEPADAAALMGLEPSQLHVRREVALRLLSGLSPEGGA